MKSRSLIIGALVTLAIVVTSFTFAFWSNVDLQGDATGTVTIGEGRQATVTGSLNTSGTGTLVPSGESGDSVSTNPVESITYTFDVLWEDNANPGAVSSVAIVVDNISNPTADGLLNFAITDGTPQSITEGVTLTITITVTLTAPANETDYNAIINEAITFDVTFTVTDPA